MKKGAALVESASDAADCDVFGELVAVEGIRVGAGRARGRPKLTVSQTNRHGKIRLADRRWRRDGANLRGFVELRGNPFLVPCGAGNWKDSPE